MNENHTQLTQKELALICDIFIKVKEVDEVILFGSRAKGTSNERSDVDLAVRGVVSSLKLEQIAMELDQLPLPYMFDLVSLQGITNRELLAHIARVGKTIYKRDASN